MASAAEQRERRDAVPDARALRVVSHRFGTFEVPATSVLHFAQGLVGLAQHRRYVVFIHRPGSPCKAMLSIDDPELAFAVAHPDAVALFAIVTIPSDPTRMTVNLMAPVVVDLRTRQARQIVLDDPRCPPDHRVVGDLPAIRP
jgi:flagellar assembly factor FliW